MSLSGPTLQGQVSSNSLVSVALSPCGLKYGSFCFIVLYRDDPKEEINTTRGEDNNEPNVTAGKLLLRATHALKLSLDEARNLYCHP